MDRPGLSQSQNIHLRQFVDDDCCCTLSLAHQKNQTTPKWATRNSSASISLQECPQTNRIHYQIYFLSMKKRLELDSLQLKFLFPVGQAIDKSVGNASFSKVKYKCLRFYTFQLQLGIVADCHKKVAIHHVPEFFYGQNIKRNCFWNKSFCETAI